MFQEGWYKFPNGNIWFVDPDQWADGVVAVESYGELGDLEDRLDAIAEQATGSIVGLSDISYQELGQDVVAFSASVAECFADEDDASEDLPQLVDPAGEEFAQFLRTQHGLSDAQIAHAVWRTTQGTELFEGEVVLNVAGTCRALHLPKPIEEAPTYVRLVVAGSFEAQILDLGEGSQVRGDAIMRLLREANYR